MIIKPCKHCGQMTIGKFEDRFGNLFCSERCYDIYCTTKKTVYDTKVCMYFVTTISGNTDDTRCVGYFSDLEDAKKVVINNCCDLYEAGAYPYAVIEAVPEGLYEYDLNPIWFEYNEKTNKYDCVQKPKAFPDGIAGYSIG